MAIDYTVLKAEIDKPENAGLDNTALKDKFNAPAGLNADKIVESRNLLHEFIKLGVLGDIKTASENKQHTAYNECVGLMIFFHQADPPTLAGTPIIRSMLQALVDGGILTPPQRAAIRNVVQDQNASWAEATFAQRVSLSDIRQAKQLP